MMKMCNINIMQAKHLQFVSGVNPFSYWLGNYAWDLINAAIVVVVSFCIFAAFQVEAYMGTYLGAVFWIMVRFTRKHTGTNFTIIDRTYSICMTLYMYSVKSGHRPYDKACVS